MSVPVGEETDVIEGVDVSLSAGGGIVTLGASDQSVAGMEDDPNGGKELHLPGEDTA